EAGRVLAVGMVRRMFPSLALAKELVEGGALGDDLRFVYREGSVYGWPVSTDAAFRRATAGGGVLTDVGSHVLDFLAAIFGAPPAIGKPTTYFECMYHQLIRTLRAVRYGEPAAVTGEDGLLVVRTIEGCYRRAMPLDLPWLSAAEQAQARERHWKRRRWAA